MPSLMRQCLQHVSGVYQRRRCHWQQVTHLHPRYTGRHDAEERPREKHHQRELISCGGDVVARPCPFGGACLEDNSKEPPHRWGRTYSEQKRANAQRSYPALPAGNCVSADRNDCVSDKLSEQQRRSTILRPHRKVGSKACDTRSALRQQQCLLWAPAAIRRAPLLPEAVLL